MESQAIEVDLEKVLDMLEKECTGYKQRWLRLRELLKLQKAAQQSVQRIGNTPCPECGKLGGSHLWSCRTGDLANR